jgi:hypothetical protein
VRESRSRERSSVEGQGSGQEGGQRAGGEGVGERADQPVTPGGNLVACLPAGINII